MHIDNRTDGFCYKGDVMDITVVSWKHEGGRKFSAIVSGLPEGGMAITDQEVAEDFVALVVADATDLAIASGYDLELGQVRRVENGVPIPFTSLNTITPDQIKQNLRDPGSFIGDSNPLVEVDSIWP